MSRAGERLTLDAFCAGLGAAEAAEAQAAAARIDGLARIGRDYNHLERRFAPWAAAALVLFGGGLWLLFRPDLAPLGLAVLGMAALPVLCFAYAWQVRHRTWADNEIATENEAHFLPQGGLYFPPDEGRPAAVVRVDWTAPEPELPISVAPRDPRKTFRKTGRYW